MKGLYDWMKVLGSLGVDGIKAFLAAGDRRAFVVQEARTFYMQVIEPLDLGRFDDFIDEKGVEAAGILAGRSYDALMKLYPDVPDKLAANTGAIDEHLASYRKFEAQVNGAS